ncbi:hypothetical protein EAF00_001736 [Botryotinia globosa]|nr:hypothetical protein EAF00_001736 [Botryotinia globosa]
MVIGGQGLEYLYTIAKWYREMGLDEVYYEIYTIPVGAKVKRLVDTTQVLQPISISPERLSTLPQRLRKEWTGIGGTWQSFAIWCFKGI